VDFLPGFPIAGHQASPTSLMIWKGLSADLGKGRPSGPDRRRCCAALPSGKRSKKTDLNLSVQVCFVVDSWRYSVRQRQKG